MAVPPLGRCVRFTVCPHARQPRDGRWRMIDEVPHQRGDVFVLASAHDIIEKQLFAVFDAERFLHIGLCCIDATRGVVGIAADDALFFQHDDFRVHGFCGRYRR